MNYLKLIGYKTLLMIFITLIFVKYFLFVPFEIDVSLNDFGGVLLILATLCLAAAGSIILQISNREADKINTQNKISLGNSVSEKTAFNLFLGLNIVGVGIGFFLSNAIGHSGFSAIFILISALLYLYATYLKKQLIIGNITVAILAAMLLILPGIFDLLPAITPKNQATQHTIFSILLDYALLAFLLNWLREMVKDQKNMDGDHKAGNHTLSVSLGKERTNKIIFVIALLPLAAVIYYMYVYLFGSQILVLYALFLLVAPLFYFLAKILSAKTKKTFSHLQTILTFTMWFAIFSIALYQLVLL